MVGLGDPVFEAVFTVDLVEAIDPHSCCPAIAALWRVGELDRYQSEWCTVRMALPRAALRGTRPRSADLSCRAAE